MSSEKEATAEVDFTFHVGPKKRVDVTIPVMVSDGGCTSLLKAGEASVKEFVSQESIPFPLEEPLVRCTEIVLQAVEESKLSQQYQTAQHETCLEQAKLWAAAFHQKTAEHASDQIGWEGAHRLAAIEEKSGRSRLFNRVVHSSHKNVERLAQFEGSLEISLSAIREGRKRAIDEAQDRQAQEMEREVMRDGSPEQLTRLVSAQIEEMDAINSLWSKKEQTETEQQQERYWSLVTSLAAAAVPSPTDPTTEECTSVAPHKPLVRVSEGSIPFPFCTGQGQLKTLYKIEATCASPIPGLCEASSGVTGSRDKLLRRERTLQALYSRDLVGLVLPVPSTGTGLSGCLEESEWGCCRAFYKAAGTTFDMHFGSVSRQLENTPKMLRAGDVCVTRHSNMLDLHTVFHLILNRFDDIVAEASSKSKSKTLDGLWRVMSIAARHDVAELIVPIPLIESTIPKNANEDEASQYVLKNVEVVLRNIRSFLSVYRPESLKRIILAIHPTLSFGGVLEKIKLLSVFGN